ncbi:galectin-8-like [Ambystoma mexicanum]|uniref:galectin-8-like n=1 Tax=Ambystoma mexicanum TaxID=8296 RepID=UPI0037E747C7
MSSEDPNFVMPFIDGLKPHTLITVQIEIPADCKQFAIDLCKDAENRIFHFNPRFQCPPYTVCNTMINNVWGKQEIKSDNFPFVRGQAYEVKIECEEDYLTVYVDGNFYTKYACRVTPLPLIKTVETFHDVNTCMVIASPMQD